VPEDKKTSAQRLVQRALSLISYDGLNPVSIAGVNPAQVYKDLGLTDPDIQAEMAPISMSSDRLENLKCDKDGNIVLRPKNADEKPDFFRFNLYKDGKRRILFHVYQPFAGPNDTLNHEDRPHEHYGKSGSLVLSGCLVNQHTEATPCDKAQADYGVYRNYRLDPKQDPRIELRGVRQFYGKLSLKTSRAYKAGQHYFLPAPPDLENLDPAKLSEHEKLSMHRVAAMPLTATLFTQEFSPERNHLTTFPLDFPEKVQQRRATDDELEMYPLDKAHELLMRMDKQITQSLAEVRKPDTIIDRAERTHDTEMSQLIARRLKQPVVAEARSS
jgi:hypothetical protein